MIEIYYINCKKDIFDLRKKFNDDAKFFCTETRETLTIPDLLFGYDGQEITLEKVS